MSKLLDILAFTIVAVVFLGMIGLVLSILYYNFPGAVGPVALVAAMMWASHRVERRTLDKRDNHE